MKLSEWARANGVSRQGATRWLHDGVLPVPARQLAAGMILAGEPVRSGTGVAVCARVSSCGRRAVLGRQVARIAEYLTASGTAPAKLVCEVGSGLNGHRTRLPGLLRDASAGTIVAGHRGRLARFGVGYLEAALAARGRELLVVEQAGVSDDLARGMAEVLTSFCARLYGRRNTGPGWPWLPRAHIGPRGEDLPGVPFRAGPGQRHQRRPGQPRGRSPVRARMGTGAGEVPA